MSQHAADSTPLHPSAEGDRARSRSFIVWVLVVLAVTVAAVILGWRADAGPADPTAARMSATSAVINSAVLVFREGLETILVLAAITAGLLGGNRAYRRPVALGGAVAAAATVATWFAAVRVIGMFGNPGLDVQAATGIPAILVLLLVMNWFFHRVYWTGWIAHHNRRRKRAVEASGEVIVRSTLIGLGLLGFTSVYREGFEIVLFLQGLRVSYGADVVLEGTTLGLLFTAAVGVITFVLHERLPYKRLLIITGVLLAMVLFVMVGEQVNEMQLAGWIPTTEISWLHIPGWAGIWFALYPTVETLVAQVLSLLLVLGSYFAAQWLKVWRPRRRGQAAAHIADRPPAAPVGAAQAEAA
jgi:high-affinity iron transporter